MGPISCGSSHSQVVFALVPRTQCRVWKQQARCCWQSCFSWDGPLLQHGKAFGSWAQLPAAWEQCCGCLVCNTERTWVRESVMDLKSRVAVGHLVRALACSSRVCCRHALAGTGQCRGRRLGSSVGCGGLPGSALGAFGS